MRQLKKTFIISFFTAFAITSALCQELNDQKIHQVKIKKQRFTQVDGFINVPENYDSPDSKIIKLPVRIIKATGSNIGAPIFYLDGGPGYSNIVSTSDTALLKNHDFVFVGYRGADGSTILKSKKIAKAIKGLSHQLLSEESLDNMANAMKEYQLELKQKNIDITNYTIIQVVEDIEYVRKQMGLQKINLLSFSYGTRVALLYNYLYPYAIQRMVMAGANPPGNFIWHPQKTEQVLDIWNAKYQAEGLGSLKEAMRTAMEHLPKRWMFYKLDADKIKTATFLVMTQNKMAVMAFDSYYKAARRKDYSGLYLLQLMFDLFMKKIIWGEMCEKGISADWQTGTDYRNMLRQEGENTTLGPNMSLLLWGSASGWNKTLIPEEYRKPALSTTETLIVSGDLDVATPTQSATEQLLPTLSSGHQLILKNMSHGDIANAQPEAYTRLLKNFYDSGMIDSTAFVTQAISLKPTKKLYRIAKWGFPVIAILKLFN